MRKSVSTSSNAHNFFREVYYLRFVSPNTCFRRGTVLKLSLHSKRHFAKTSPIAKMNDDVFFTRTRLRRTPTSYPYAHCTLQANLAYPNEKVVGRTYRIHRLPASNLCTDVISVNEPRTEPTLKIDYLKFRSSE